MIAAAPTVLMPEPDSPLVAAVREAHRLQVDNDMLRMRLDAAQALILSQQRHVAVLNAHVAEQRQSLADRLSIIGSLALEASQLRSDKRALEAAVLSLVTERIEPDDLTRPGPFLATPEQAQALRLAKGGTA